MLGSHNSGSFSKQIGWTKFIPKFFSRCQRLNFREQYDSGVRYFDLRVTYFRGDYYIAHGLVRYNIKLEDAIREISGFKEQCYFSLIIEDTFLEFKGSLNVLMGISTGRKAKLHYISSKKTGKSHYNSSAMNKYIAWMIPTAKKWDILIPEVDCKDINRFLDKRELIMTESSVCIVDFVETLK